MATWKYIHPVDENTVLDIYGTIWKLFNKNVFSVMYKDGFYNLAHTISKHRTLQSGPTKYQYDHTPTPERNVSSYPAPPWNRKGKEGSDENNDDLQWESVYCYLIVDATDYVDTGVVIYICSVYAYAPVNNSNNNTTIIGYLESYFDYFDCHYNPVTVYLFDYFLDAHVSPFPPVRVHFKSTTAAVDILDKFIDSPGSPFYLVHVPSGYTISFREQYP